MMFQLVRPGDLWGPTQYRASVIADLLRPTVVGIFVAGLTAATCLRRRSVRPGLLAIGTTVATCALTVSAKTVVGRSDPHGWVSSHGGSFPSGHTTVLIVGLGLAVVMSRTSRRPQIWLIPAAGGAVMCSSLVISGTHWATDVVGGALLAISILAATLGIILDKDVGPACGGLPDQGSTKDPIRAERER